jgi:hypothetical protein
MSLGYPRVVTWQLGNLGCKHWAGARKLLFFCSSTIRHHLLCFPSHCCVSILAYFTVTSVGYSTGTSTMAVGPKNRGVRLPAGQKIVSFFKAPSRALWPTNPPIHLGSNVTLSCGDEQSELEFLHLPSSAKFANAWGYLHATVRLFQWRSRDV